MNMCYIVINILFQLLIHCYALPLDPILSISNKYNNIYYASNGVNINDTIRAANDYIDKWRIANEVPGLVAGISIAGKEVWSEAFGLADIENNVRTRPDSVWRLASVSKALTTAIVGRLIDRRLINLDNSIHDYLSENVFPIKQWNGTNVTITVKQVMAHMAGLRVSVFPDDYLRIEECANVTETLRRFKDEPLMSAPGTTFDYSNYGFQVIGAIIESILKKSYEQVANTMFVEELGMTSTSVERHDLIVAHRVRYYWKNKPYTNDILSNAHIVDELVSYECNWSSGGLLSTVPDLLRFGYAMIGSFNGQSGFLSQSTVRQFWTSSWPKLFDDNETTLYIGEGWLITNITEPIHCSDCQTPSIKYLVSHSGSITGVTTVLAIFPEQEFVIAVLTNLGNIDLRDVVIQIATIFMRI